MILESVMVIEDSEADQFLTRMRLVDYFPDVKIIEAFDGQEALELLSELEIKPDLILLDINMPRMDGFEFLEHYSEHPYQSTTIVMLTSSDQQADQEKVMDYEFVKEYFIKPLDEEYLEVIKNL